MVRKDTPTWVVYVEGLLEITLAFLGFFFWKLMNVCLFSFLISSTIEWLTLQFCNNLNTPESSRIMTEVSPIIHVATTDFHVQMHTRFTQVLLYHMEDGIVFLSSNKIFWVTTSTLWIGIPKCETFLERLLDDSALSHLVYIYVYYNSPLSFFFIIMLTIQLCGHISANISVIS